MHLLDVSVLVALVDANHVHHGAVHRWFDSRPQPAWASCAQTQQGLLRILLSPAYSGAWEDRGVVHQLVAGVFKHPHHRFLARTVPLLDERLFDWGRVSGHRQVTDIYLLGLAVHHRCRFATLDGRVHADAVRGGAAALELLPV